MREKKKKEEEVVERERKVFMVNALISFEGKERRELVKREFLFQVPGPPNIDPTLTS